jgi:hypothetical protein
MKVPWCITSLATFKLLLFKKKLNSNLEKFTTAIINPSTYMVFKYKLNPFVIIGLTTQKAAEAIYLLKKGIKSLLSSSGCHTS